MGWSCSEEDVFSAALALPEVERTRYLERVCAEDSRRLARLKGLLNVAADAASFVTERHNGQQVEGPGDWIDRYQLIEELGEGGCGVAYLAEQWEPIRRHVALKLVKAGMDTRAVIARFESERQALAVMDHPHIAQVFDAGVAASGRPYFVMELVRGIRITDYCNQSRLTIPERLLLFMQVCRAIQHAHSKGIIHRDLKPSNVLVTMHDGVPVAKVIDFGLAKAMQGRSVDQTAFTAVEAFLGTPGYMSPEQMEPGQPNVDTRSDIFGLGVLLYELLTSMMPFDPAEQLDSRFDLVHRIRIEEPTKPSKRLESFADALSITAPSLYGSAGAKLLRQVRGDLDWIVMRCLEKEPSRRYQTPNDLKLDIERHLRHETVLARPPSLGYTIRRFARRHKLIFAASVVGVVFVAFLASFAITVAQQAQRIAAERDRAQRARQHAELVSGVILAAADPFENLAYEISGAAVLDQAASTILSELPQGTEARARLAKEFGRAYRRRGALDKAIVYLSDAVDTWSRIEGGDISARIGAMVELSIAQRMSGDVHSARRTIMEADELAQMRGLEQSPVYAKLLLNRARNEMDVNNLSQARMDLETSLMLTRQHAGRDSKEVGDVLLTQSRLFQWTDDLPEAERAARESVRVFETAVSPMYPDRVLAESRLAEVLYLRDRVRDAEILLVESLRKQTQLFGRNSWPVADVLDSLAKIRRSQGRLDEAEGLAREAIASQSAALGEGHPNTTYLRISLAALLIDRGKLAEAERELKRALVSQGTVRPASVQNEQYVASAEYLLGEVLLATDRLSEAEHVLVASMERWRRSGAPAWRAARSASALGEVLYRQGRVGEAESYLLESNRELSAAAGAEIDAKIKASERVTRLLQRSGYAPRLE